MITLHRAYMPNDTCTVGKLTLPNGWSCYTMERPWVGNERSISCIPEGTYTMAQRVSPVVQRITRKRYQSGWEIEHVAGRTYIMIHPGNYVTNSDGCLLVGRSLTVHPDRGELMVTHSQDVFDELMKHLSAQDVWQIRISTGVFT